MAEPDELPTVAEIRAELTMNQQTILHGIDCGYLPGDPHRPTGAGQAIRLRRATQGKLHRHRTTAGWRLGRTPVAPGADAEAGEPEPDQAAEKQAG